MNESDDAESCEYEQEEGEAEQSEMESEFDPVTSRQVHSDKGSDQDDGVLGGNPLFGLAAVPEDHKENDVTADEKIKVPKKVTKRPSKLPKKSTKPIKEVV